MGHHLTFFSRRGPTAAGCLFWALALGLLATSASVRAHDPSLHGFNLVVFERPFPAPEFTLQNINGEPERLNDYRGRYVLLNFWATWCPPCVEEMPAMQVLHERYQTLGFAVVAVSSDEQGRAVVAPFADRFGISFPLLLDPGQRVSSIFGASSLPVSFILDREGRVIAAAQGAREWASEEALTTLDEMILPR